MTHWQQADLERCLDCHFRRVDTEPESEWLEARFSSRGLQFVLIIDAPREWVWLRADPVEPDQATPAFEFTFRSDRIRIAPGDYGSEAIHFDFTGGSLDLDPRHIRLVIEKLPDDSLYVWPVVGNADPVHPDHSHNNNSGEQNIGTEDTLRTSAEEGNPPMSDTKPPTELMMSLNHLLFLAAIAPKEIRILKGIGLKAGLLTKRMHSYFASANS